MELLRTHEVRYKEEQSFSVVSLYVSYRQNSKDSLRSNSQGIEISIKFASREYVKAESYSERAKRETQKQGTALTFNICLQREEESLEDAAQHSHREKEFNTV